MIQINVLLRQNRISTFMQAASHRRSLLGSQVNCKIHQISPRSSPHVSSASKLYIYIFEEFSDSYWATCPTTRKSLFLFFVMILQINLYDLNFLMFFRLV